MKKEEVLEYVTDVRLSNPQLNTQANELYLLAYDYNDTWNFYYDNGAHSYFNMPYYEFSNRFFLRVARNFSELDPTYTKEQIRNGMVNVNVITKAGKVTGKRCDMKLGKLLGIASPNLTDVSKEKIVIYLKETNADLDANFYIQDTGFEEVVTMRLAKPTLFSTGYRDKNAHNSCMRYSASDMGLDRHPYEAYESGDFQIAYLEKDGRLYARTVVHKESKTNSAIYAVSKPALDKLKEHLRELDIHNVSEDGSEWEGAKLLHIETYCHHEDDGITDVILTPYLDFWDHSYGYSDGKHIYITTDDSKGVKVSLQNGDGWEET